MSPSSCSGWQRLSEVHENFGRSHSKITAPASPNFAAPSLSLPPTNILNADSGFPSTVFAAPWKPMAAAWCPEQLDGHPEIQILGSAPSGIFASRTASTAALSAAWLSLTPCWQIAAPIQATLFSKVLWAPSFVASRTFSASSAVRLMI